MIKKDYMKPTMQTVELKHRTMILAGSVDQYNMNRSLQDEEVDEGREPPEEEVRHDLVVEQLMDEGDGVELFEHALRHDPVSQVLVKDFEFHFVSYP